MKPIEQWSEDDIDALEAGPETDAIVSTDKAVRAMKLREVQ